MKDVLALSCGDPAGIGIEIVLKAWMKRHVLALPSFFLIGDPHWVRSQADLFKLPVPVAVLNPARQTHDIFNEALPVEPLRRTRQNHLAPSSHIRAATVIEAIERGVELVMSGKAGALVTCPIAKKTLYEAGFSFPGHTEFLSHLAEMTTGQNYRPVMMLAGPQLRTVPITIHMALAQVSKHLTTALIIETAQIVARDLRDRFALPYPRLAVAGLNPHAGENGTIGNEDEAVVRPAVLALRQTGLDITGPLSADTMFHEKARQNYDVALCMYHDQALIPIKTIDFDAGVNVTLGLPFIRTSPDHGTAFDIAGQGIAKPDSLIAALQLAARMVENQWRTKNLTRNLAEERK